MYTGPLVSPAAREQYRVQKEKQRRELSFQRHRKALSLSAARVDQLERRIEKIQVRQITTALEHAGAIIIQTRARIFIVKRRMLAYKAMRLICRWLWQICRTWARKRSAARIYSFFALCMGRSKRHAARRKCAGLCILRALALNASKWRAKRAQAGTRAAIQLVKGCLSFVCHSLAASSVSALATAPLPSATDHPHAHVHVQPNLHSSCPGHLPHATAVHSVPSSRPSKRHIGRPLGSALFKGRGVPASGTIVTASAAPPSHELKMAKATAISPARPGRTYTPSPLVTNPSVIKMGE